MVSLTLVELLIVSNSVYFLNIDKPQADFIRTQQRNRLYFHDHFALDRNYQMKQLSRSESFSNQKFFSILVHRETEKLFLRTYKN